MATFYSSQRTKLRSTPITRLDAWDESRIIAKYFEYTVPASGAPAVNDIIELIEIPADSRLLGGEIVFTAMSSGAGDSSIQIGTAASAARYLGTTSVDAAGTSKFGNTAALQYGELVTVKTPIYAKVITEAWAAAGVLRGIISYLR